MTAGELSSTSNHRPRIRSRRRRVRRCASGVIARRTSLARRRSSISCVKGNQSLASETVHIVQAYVQGRGSSLKAEPQTGCKTAEEARRKAERLAPLRLGVVAFSATADTEMGDYDESPAILFRSGQLPPPWNEE